MPSIDPINSSSAVPVSVPVTTTVSGSANVPGGGSVGASVTGISHVTVPGTPPANAAAVTGGLQAGDITGSANTTTSNQQDFIQAQQAQAAQEQNARVNLNRLSNLGGGGKI
jgi:hypothetical protein